MLAPQAFKPTLATERLSCRVDAEHGTYSIYNIRTNSFVVDAAAMAVMPPLRSGSPPLFLGEALKVDEQSAVVEPNLIKLRYNHPTYPLSVTAEFRTQPDDPNAVTIGMTVLNRAESPVKINALYPLWVDPRRDACLDLGGSWSHAAMLINGKYCWSDTKIEFFSSPDGTVYDSSNFTLFYNELSNQDLFLGFETMQSQFTKLLFSPRTDGMHVHAVCEVDDAKTAAGGTLRSETLVIRVGDAPRVQLDAFVTRTKESNKVFCRGPECPPPTGWTTQGLCRPQEITEADVLRNAKWLVDHRKTLPLETVIVHEGWQAGIGEWLGPNLGRFPSGMKSLASQIASMDLVPGLWIAPFLAQSDSLFAEQHPEWFLRDDHGQQVHVRKGAGAKCAVLDPTMLEVQEWLTTVFHTISAEWGYKYLILDDLHYLTDATGFHNSHISRFEIFHKSLRAIRDAVGEDVMLHAINVPMGASAGMVDVVRSGPELTPVWHSQSDKGMRVPGRNALIRSVLRESFWLTDLGPLCAVPEETDTGEKDLYYALSAVLGDTRFVSGELSDLPDEMLDTVRAMLRARAVGGFVPNLMSVRGAPNTYVVPFGERRLVSLFNWDDGEKQVEFSFEGIGLDRYSPFLVYDISNQKLEAANVRGEWTEHNIHPRSCRNLNILPMPNDDTPVLIGSSLSFTQGAEELIRAERSGSLFELEFDTNLWQGRPTKFALFQRGGRQAELVHAAGCTGSELSCDGVSGGQILRIDVSKVTDPKVSFRLSVG